MTSVLDSWLRSNGNLSAEAVDPNRVTPGLFGLISFLTFAAAVGAVSGGVGFLIAKGNGRGKAGFWWSFFLGPIGWIVASLLKPVPQEKIQQEVSVAEASRLARSLDASGTSSSPTAGPMRDFRGEALAYVLREHPDLAIVATPKDFERLETLVSRTQELLELHASETPAEERAHAMEAADPQKLIGLLVASDLTIQTVSPNGVAESIGLRPGDRITSVSGIIVSTAAEFNQRALNALRDEADLRFGIKRNTEDLLLP